MAIAETQRGRFYSCLLYGQSLDYPENCQIFLSNKVEQHFNRLEVDMEDIENALWSQGDVALDASNHFIIYIRSHNAFVGAYIDMNKRQDGYFIAINYCDTILLSRTDIKEETCPVIIV